MPRLFATRASQRVQSAEFIFGVGDTLKGAIRGNPDGPEIDLGKTTVGEIVADVIWLPPGSVVVGGDVSTDEAFTAAFGIAVGDEVDPDRYLTSAARQSLGRTELVPTGFKNVDGLPIRITLTNGAAAEDGEGKMTVRVQFITTYREEDVAARR